MKNYSYRGTVLMVLLITIVFNLFLVIIFIFLVLLRWMFFRSETISFSVRVFLLPWDFFFQHENFSFCVRLFISLWVFFFPLQNVSNENYSTQSKNFWSTIQKEFSRLCSLHLVLWARHFYSLEKEEGERARRLW